MPYDNISATISDQSMAEIKRAIAVIQNNLPFLINLTPDERRKRFKRATKASPLSATASPPPKTTPTLSPASLILPSLTATTNSPSPSAKCWAC
ncbi:hypothetical protein NC969_09820 [Leptolyngbya subtilissima ST-M1]|uniref:hypothetical protein n=1 Tax=Leptolyngbya subtilissima TaxID=1346803 RepID=UPI0018F008D1